MVENFDITCTATLRPELLSKTLQSFSRNLFGQYINKARLIINIDFIGAENEADELRRLDLILEEISKYKFYDVKIKFCKKPNFARAFYWCMSNLKNEFVFNLEEDWELLYPIDFYSMYKQFKKNKSLVHLRLSAFRSETNTLKNWNKFLYWNGEFFEVKKEDRGTIGWCGHPSLNRTEFMKLCLKYIDPESNPEKQIKGRRYEHPMNYFIFESRFGAFQPQNANKVIIDLGRKWMVENGFAKKGSKAFFTQWEKVE